MSYNEGDMSYNVDGGVRHGILKSGREPCVCVCVCPILQRHREKMRGQEEHVSRSKYTQNVHKWTNIDSNYVIFSEVT